MKPSLPSGLRLTAGQAKRLLPLLLSAACLWLLWQKGGTLDWHAVRHALTEISLWNWGLALGFTAASFAALAQYDVIAHRHFGTGTQLPKARRAGASAIALGQVIGFGPAVGAAVRWRLMPGLGHGLILRLTGFVTVTFLASWGVLALGFAMPVMAGQAWLGFLLLPGIALGVAGVLLRFSRLRLFRFDLRLPSLPAAVQLLALSFVDMAFAALALYVLLPSGIDLPLAQLLACYMLALGAGLVGGTPGGVGPFELTLAGLLPMLGHEELAACLLAYRAVYYALPCLAGAAYALVAEAEEEAPRSAPEGPISGGRAEHAIAAQNATQALCVTRNGAASHACLLPSAHSLTLFLGATHGPLLPLLGPLRRQARDQNRVACLYKVNARDAALLRREGWRVAPVAEEAVLDPKGFTLDGAAFRQLRRVLRKSDKAGVHVRRLTDPRPTDWADMARINAEWARAHGGERGFSMGRFCPAFLSDKPIFAAFVKDRMVAYASCVESPETLSLDLMRQRRDAPSGAMQAIVVAMIRFGAEAGFQEVSLAALPHARLSRFAASEGLSRFKTAFAPRWRRLYIAAPNAVSLAVAGLDLWLAIHRPAPLPTARSAQYLGDWEADLAASSATGSFDPAPIGGEDAEVGAPVLAMQASTRNRRGNVVTRYFRQ